MQPIRKILVAVDFSGHSEQAIDAAIEMAGRFEAGVDVVHAVHFPIPMVVPYGVAVPSGYLDETRRAAGEKLASVAERIQKQGIEVHTHLREVPAAPSIVEVADEVGADLIVMGTHGHTGLKHAVLGSVAERTLRTAPCSVLTVKGRSS